METEVASLKQTIVELEKRLTESQAENGTLQAGRQSDAETLSEAAENKLRLTGGFAEPPWFSQLA